MRRTAAVSGTSTEPTSAGAGRATNPAWVLIASTAPSPERSWSERVRAGDQEAFAALFRALYPSLCGLVARRVGSPEIAEELVQDVFARVWERRETLDPEQSLTRYFYRAARNQALNYLKHRRVVSRSQHQVGEGPHGSVPGPEEEVRYRELSAAAQEAIEQLPDRCREIFLLSRQGEMKYAEIACLLGLSVKTVETQMGRALRGLRAVLLPHLRD